MKRIAFIKELSGVGKTYLVNEIKNVNVIAMEGKKDEVDEVYNDLKTIIDANIIK